MKILSIDIGTGTQDIFLCNTNLDVENGFKLVLPSPTMIIHRRIKRATSLQQPILISGVMMGSGPSSWAVEAHASAGLPVYATPEAAKTINDELEKVERLGIRLVSEDEARALPETVQRVEFRDFDFAAISETFSRFGVSLNDLAAVAVAVFDHGNAPAGISDRQFRFDYLDERIRQRNALSTFAFTPEHIPPIMTRLQAVAASARGVDASLVVMDTAPAAILGACFDPQVTVLEHKLIANIGNFHTLAFRLGPQGIEGVFEHHTGEIDRARLQELIQNLANGTLTHADVFDDMGHGALLYNTRPMPPIAPGFDVVISGPRRSLFSATRASDLRPYFAAPFGDMMIAGCFGLLAATADTLPELAGPIHKALHSPNGPGIAPWDAEP